jgi:hypothetical protein
MGSAVPFALPGCLRASQVTVRSVVAWKKESDSVAHDVTVERGELLWGRIAVAACLGLLLVVGLVVFVTSRSGALKKMASRPTASNPHQATKPKATARCPLTDLPAPDGVVPSRPALAVKIGNEPAARPQSGLNEADIVYDTPAEGFIMRYIAIYQCQSSASIGPIRSLRWVDWHEMQAYGHPILAFAGGINPDVDTVENLKWLDAADLLTSAQHAGIRIANRVAPDNLYSSTSALWGLFPTNTRTPKPVFQYSALLPASATPASRLGIKFSEGTDVVWEWDTPRNAWLHTYDGTVDIDTLNHQPVTATNVIVQIVQYSFGSYPESAGGTGDVESQTLGFGPGYVLRNGKVMKVTWYRSSLNSPTIFTDPHGQRVGLAPGRTWVELVPNTTASEPGALTITP